MADKQLNNMPKADASGGKEELILSPSSSIRRNRQ